MTKLTVEDLNYLVEMLIRIRDRYDLSRKDRDYLADAGNVIYYNIDKLTGQRAEQ